MEERRGGHERVQMEGEVKSGRFVLFGPFACDAQIYTLKSSRLSTYIVNYRHMTIQTLLMLDLVHHASAEG